MHHALQLYHWFTADADVLYNNSWIKDFKISDMKQTYSTYEYHSMSTTTWVPVQIEFPLKLIGMSTGRIKTFKHEYE